MTQGQCYPWLTHLTTKIGGRLAGSPQAAAAVEYTKQMLDTLNLDSVWLEPVMVPHWVRGEKEQVRIVNSGVVGSMDLNALALGNSIGTGGDGITAEVIEVKSLDEVEKDLSKLYIESKNYQFFINYLKNENKELVFKEDYIQNLIYKKTKKCLESIKSINEFNNIKEDLIYTIDLIDLIDKKLELFEIMEKLKDQYDSEVINEKIGNIKDKLLNKNDNKIEIKKSNIRSI